MKMKHLSMGFALCALLLAQAGFAAAQEESAANPAPQCDCPFYGSQGGPMGGSQLSAEELAQLRAQAEQMQQRLQPLQDQLYAANLRLEVLRSASDVTAAQLSALVDEVVSLQSQIRQIVDEYQSQMGDQMPMRGQMFMFDGNMMHQGMGMMQHGMGMMPGGMGMMHNGMGMMQHGMNCINGMGGMGTNGGGVHHYMMNQPGQMFNQMPGQRPSQRQNQLHHGNGMHHRYTR